MSVKFPGHLNSNKMRKLPTCSLGQSIIIRMSAQRRPTTVCPWADGVCQGTESYPPVRLDRVIYLLISGISTEKCLGIMKRSDSNLTLH